MERLELSQDNLLEPKSSASTSSATFALYNELQIIAVIIAEHQAIIFFI